MACQYTEKFDKVFFVVCFVWAFVFCINIFLFLRVIVT